MDRGHELTDKELNKLERRIAKEYKTAVDDMQVKLRNYLEKTEAQRQIQEKLLNAGKITKEEYGNWCYRHNMVGKRWENMLDTLTQDMHNANKIALKMTKETMPDVYALNHNFGVYQIEHDGFIDTGLTLYNHDTAEYLLGDQRQLMPRPSTRKAAQIAANKDMQWNMRKIQSAVLQGVLQGESPYAVADRLRSVGSMNENASIRYARTMTTSAQNAGRYEAFRRATKLGVDLTIEWQATLDSRTRHDHRMMHGQRTEVDKPFHTPDGYTIYYPADCTGESNAPQKEIWNCRCTLLSWVKGYEGDTVKDSPKMEGKSFEEWQQEKAQDNQFTFNEESNKIEKEKTNKEFVKSFEEYNPENLKDLTVSERAIEDVRYAVAGMEDQEQKVWKAAIGSTNYVSDTDSYYDPMLRITHIEEGATGRAILHETGHAIDEGCLLIHPNEWETIKSASAYTEYLVREAEYYGNAKKDVVTFCEKLGIKLNADGDWLSGEPDFIVKFSKWADAFLETHSEEHFRAVSDFIDGMTLGEMNPITRNYGHHSPAYWTAPHSGERGTPAFDEQWAHYCSLRAERRTDELSLLEEIAPNRMKALAETYRMVFGA